MEPDKQHTELVTIGGSAGSIHVLMELLTAISPQASFATIIVLHRMRNVTSEMNEILSVNNADKIFIEPDDKTIIEPGHIYLAPQNYHLLIEADHSISLDYSETVHYSRPSIDVTFESVASVYKNKCIGILLSGANMDGAQGLAAIAAKGGTAIIQEPATAEYKAMPQAGVNLVPGAIILSPPNIARYLKTL
ncbi:chemotaxis protein CheB [Chitinophagaceae bacterium MMS25-I14]